MDIENIDSDDINRKLSDIMVQAENIIQEKNEIKKRNKQLEELARAQQDKLNNIYEASAKAQYEADLWRKRYEAVEQYVQERLEITPASIPYDNMRLALIRFMRLDLHELY